MFGIFVEGLASLHCNNYSVVTNSIKSGTTLKKCHNAIAYHKVTESVAQGTIKISKESRESNLADVLTNLWLGHDLVPYSTYPLLIHIPVWIPK
jgi:hypothetical protein